MIIASVTACLDKSIEEVIPIPNNMLPFSLSKIRIVLKTYLQKGYIDKGLSFKKEMQAQLNLFYNVIINK